MSIPESAAAELCRPAVDEQQRTQGDPKSMKDQAMFLKFESHLNDWICESDAEYSVPVRWLRAKPSCVAGGFSYGCGLCFNLVTSRAWSDALKIDTAFQKTFSHGSKLTMARLASTAKPTKHNLRVHMSSAMHMLARQFFYAGGETISPWMLQKLRRPAPAASALGNSDDLRGLPTPTDIVRAWKAICVGDSSRSHSSKNSIDEWLQSTAAEDHSLSKDTLTRFAHCLAEVVRSQWREQLSAALSVSLSMDGHGPFDELHFMLVTPEFRLVHGMVGLAQPQVGSKEKLTSTAKSERSAEAIGKELKAFCARESTSGVKYNLGEHKDCLRALIHRTHCLATDRCAEAQLCGRILARDHMTSVTSVADLTS